MDKAGINNELIANLLQEKAHIWRQWGSPIVGLELALKTSIASGDTSGLIPKVSSIALDNLRAAIQVRDIIFHSKKVDGCLFVHGSTGKGKGKIGPNLEFSFEGDKTSPQLDVKVIPDCRDDVDLVWVVNEPGRWEQFAHQMVFQAKDLDIDVTINMVSFNEARRDIQNSDSPALRRILLFNTPKCLFGENYFENLMNLAIERRTDFDLPHELDFRLLMRVSTLLATKGMALHTFSAEELMILFPTFYLAYKNDLHFGFPRVRVKIT